MNNDNEIKAAAVMGFVNMMIGAFNANFVDKNNPTLAEIHRTAQNHIKDSYGVAVKNIEDEWGRDTAIDCGFVGRNGELILPKALEGSES